MSGGRRVAIVVLGDLGRSPRMQYHALALADDGAEVDLVGYAGRPPDRAVAAHRRIHLHLLAPPWRQRAPRWLFLPAALAGLFAEAAALGRILLWEIPRPDALLVQNPPAFPTLAVGLLVARARSTRLIVDWHNFGADLLGLRLGAGHPVVRVARAVERALGRRADGHLCVSEAMRATLAARWGVPAARVLRDRPAKRVGRPAAVERQRLFDRLDLRIDAAAPDRRAVIVTSSSWTADEDFSLLLDALVRCDRAREDAARLPALHFVLTGEGALRRHWEQRIAALGLRRVRVSTVWASAEDYPLLLASADLGISLHRSASGVDLPMKIADMFGAGLPVCALAYGPVIAELVREGENGLLFTSAAELAERIDAALAGFPEATATLDRLRRGVARLAPESWADGWAREARGLFQELVVEKDRDAA